METEIVEQALCGGSEALEALLAASWVRGYRLALHLTRDPSLAEDVAQDACLAAARSLSKLREPSRYLPWFYQIVYRFAKQHLRKSRPSTASLPEDLPASRSVTAEEHMDLEAALGALPERLRTTLVLYYWAGLSAPEIAHVMGTTATATRFRLTDARRRLQRLLRVSDDEASRRLVIGHA
jgi:RNA polymerase sigma-70 factor (ECF subfamily)